MRAIVLSAGYGTRLWPLTEDRTKPAIPILGKPLVGYVAEYLAGFGVNEIIVNLHHRPESVREALGNGSDFGVKLRYVEEPEILGTSGALDNAREFFQTDTFVVVNGKIITDIDLSAAFETHRKREALATLVINKLRGTLQVAAVIGREFALALARSLADGQVYAAQHPRETELAVRTAIGAPRGRLIQQLLTESFVLGAIGGSAGLPLPAWGAELTPDRYVDHTRLVDAIRAGDAARAAAEAGAFLEA